MHSSKARLSPLIIILAMFGLVASGFAQATYGPDGGWGRRGMGHGGGRMGTPGRGERLPSPEQVEGPATPTVLQQLVDLTPEELRKYTDRYDQHIADTKSVRDSLRTTMQAIRAAFEDGNRESARDQRPVAERLWKDLSPKDEAFSKGLKDLLTKEQLAQYKKWQKEQAPPERWGSPPGPPPGSDETGRI
jgi:hypothetical protein